MPSSIHLLMHYPPIFNHCWPVRSREFGMLLLKPCHRGIEVFALISWTACSAENQPQSPCCKIYKRVLWRNPSGEKPTYPHQLASHVGELSWRWITSLSQAFGYRSLSWYLTTTSRFWVKTPNPAFPEVLTEMVRYIDDGKAMICYWYFKLQHFGGDLSPS